MIDYFFENCDVHIYIWIDYWVILLCVLIRIIIIYFCGSLLEEMWLVPYAKYSRDDLKIVVINILIIQHSAFNNL